MQFGTADREVDSSMNPRPTEHTGDDQSPNEDDGRNRNGDDVERQKWPRSRQK
jgi:hypothetical protein